MHKSLEQILQEIHSGETSQREWLIVQYRPFIIRAVCHICKSHMDWNDDEASVGLIAFNEAIDRYDAMQGKTFDNFAFMIIRNRLIDEFRRNGKQLKTENLVFNDDDEFELSSSDIFSSLEAYEKEKSSEELTHELIRYDEMLQRYGVQLEELEECSPTHQDTRRQMIRLAKQVVDHTELRESLQRTKQLPIKGMLKIAGVSKKTLERNRKYLIALILIFTFEDFSRIRSSISFAGLGE
ncbi:RNA polymerase sigma-I factor [Cohnella sp.]|uniref:RNA polymerase sigma-I factor n=1 Tax=Cohnella sp. TaxID=1883426 RepID=UPI00356A3CE6